MHLIQGHLTLLFAKFVNSIPALLCMSFPYGELFLLSDILIIAKNFSISTSQVSLDMEFYVLMKVIR